jgi:hypothetical protein
MDIPYFPFRELNLLQCGSSVGKVSLWVKSD